MALILAPCLVTEKYYNFPDQYIFEYTNFCAKPYMLTFVLPILQSTKYGVASEVKCRVYLTKIQFAKNVEFNLVLFSGAH